MQNECGTETWRIPPMPRSWQTGVERHPVRPFGHKFGQHSVQSCSLTGLPIKEEAVPPASLSGLWLQRSSANTQEKKV